MSELSVKKGPHAFTDTQLPRCCKLKCRTVAGKEEEEEEVKHTKTGFFKNAGNTLEISSFWS